MAPQSKEEEMSGSCFGGLGRFFLSPPPQLASREEAGRQEESSAAVGREGALKTQVEKALQPHLQALQESLTSELQGMVSRVLKAQQTSGAPLNLKSRSVTWKQTSAPCYSRGGAKEEPMSPVARLPEDVGLPQVEPAFSRSSKRRWTAAGANIEGAVAFAIAAAEEFETPGASTVVSATASEAQSEVAESDCDVSPSKRPSLDEQEGTTATAHRQPQRRLSRISFQSPDLDANEGLSKDQKSSDEDDDDDERSKTPPRSDISEHTVRSDTSSVVWRKDALDVGEGLAAEAAAKKGNTSVDSIVALVQTERERWDEEKQALEARLEELKEQLRSLQAKHQPDAEKEALKLQYQELRKAQKARSRFGAWVCERHMKESDDEEETDAEKEALRQRMSKLSAQLRAAKAAAGAAASSQSESDISPIRRASPPPGPSIRRC